MHSPAELQKRHSNPTATHGHYSERLKKRTLLVCLQKWYYRLHLLPRCMDKATSLYVWLHGSLKYHWRRLLKPFQVLITLPSLNNLKFFIHAPPEKLI